MHTLSSSHKQAAHRLKILEGQLKALGKMIERDEYCVDILHQSLAVQNSLKSLYALVLENHLKTCVLRDMRKKGGGKSVQELLRLYRLKK